MVSRARPQSARPPEDAKSRLLKFGAFLLVWVLIIAGRLFYIQVLQKSFWDQRAERQQQRTVHISPQRGAIYDRNGQELAMTVRVESIFAVPSEIPDPKTASSLLAAVTGEDASVLLERMRAPKDLVWIARNADAKTAERIRALKLPGIRFRKNSIFARPAEIPNLSAAAAKLAEVLNDDADSVLDKLQAPRDFVWISRKVDADVARRVRALGLRGIYFQNESKRFYPKRTLAAHVLGYVGMDDKGLAGIERSYQKELNGVNGRVIFTLDARRKMFGRVEQPPEPGSNVVLTIDEKIQYIAEKELEQAMEETHAHSGAVVVQNPRTGEIFALADAPSFNPNRTDKITPAKLRNHAVTNVYEPGSVFKTVTYSAVFDQKLAKPEELVNCDPGYIMVGGIRIRDAHHIGTVTLEEGYAHSSDVAAVKMALRLGPERFYKYIRAYGFGEQTDIELPAETRGLLRSPNRWNGATIGAMAIGQAIGVTPLQVVSMMSTVANDGIYSAPRIVAGVTQPGQGYRRIEFHPQGQHRVISSYTAAIMRRLAQEVVLNGTARRAILDGYTSAGKTGTAQKVDPATHRYSKTDYVASFVGFAPVNNPVLTIAVVLDTPQGLHQGGQVSAPVFKRVAEQVLAYYGVPHDVAPSQETERRLLAARAGEHDNEDSEPQMAAQVIDLDSAGDSAQALKPPAPTSIDPRGGTVVLDQSEASTVPSLLGLSMRAAVETAHKAGFELQVVGRGVAREQQPPAGAYLPPGSRIAVRFAR
jgi:cell division protein FtsI (penicillin-binding protein 3)